MWQHVLIGGNLVPDRTAEVSSDMHFTERLHLDRVRNAPKDDYRRPLDLLSSSKISRRNTFIEGIGTS